MCVPGESVEGGPEGGLLTFRSEIVRDTCGDKETGFLGIGHLGGE